jgi:ubiquinone/menaquinone biosynthesis C-methylase UbiE
MIILNYETLIDPLFRDVRNYVPDFCGMKAGDKVIDVCCGTGAQVIEYGRRGIEATGIDIDPNMIKTAEKNHVKSGAENISFQLADAAALTFPDGYFDYASVSLALHDKERELQSCIISEMKRVVKKGGFLVIIDYNAPLPMHPWTICARVVEFFVGGSHYQGFKEYLANGGIENILKIYGLPEERRAYLKSGLLLAVKAVNP